MRAALQAEGWRLLEHRGYIWWHVPTGNQVNCNGGVYETVDAATRAAFGSATRATLTGQRWTRDGRGNEVGR